MPDSVVYVPAQRHRCDVGWTERECTIPAAPVPGGSARTVQVRGQWDKPGTVRRCDCGRHWRARRRYRNTLPGLAPTWGIEWVREGRLRRWWRTRKEHTDG